MSYLSRFYLNPQSRGGRKLLGNRQVMHAALMAAFPPDALEQQAHRMIWRQDQDGHRHVVYVVSADRPDLTHVIEQGGWQGQVAETAEYDRFLNGLSRGQQWSFRLTANPVKSLAAAQGRGKVVPHVTPAQQIRWLQDRSEGWGFHVLGLGDLEKGDRTDPAVAVTRRQDHRFGRRDVSHRSSKSRVTVRLAQFDGALQVDDVALLKDALVKGMGRAKAYGAGMMTLRPLQKD